MREGVNLDHAKWFAAAHDQGVWQCLCRIMQILPTCGVQELSSLSMWEGGIGLRSARRSQPAAHWASWADALKMVKERHPIVADTILGALESGAPIRFKLFSSAVKSCVMQGSTALRGVSWLMEVVEEEEDPCQPRFGWHQKASSAIEKHHFMEHERVMMRSQSGTPFSQFSCGPDVKD